MNSLLISDAYKQSHRVQFPKGTNLVYSNWTPRSEKYAKTNGGIVVFGIQGFLKKITKEFNDNFFNLPKEEVLKSFSNGYKSFFGVEPDTLKHVEELHDLGYLPIVVKSLPEGSICPIGVPMLTIYNSLPNFFWITNFLETIMSCELWQPITSATISKGYKDIVMEWSKKTCDNNEHIPFQCHDFSMRGMAGLESAMASGAGHLLNFAGTDTIPSVYYLQNFYNADLNNELVGTSIPATEHSVMSMGTLEDEIGTFKRLITETYPNGYVSIVSDTWNLWTVLTNYLPKLKEEVMSRDGKVVVRPDSGDPIDIICGSLIQSERNENNENNLSAEDKGVVEILWDIFGGTINSKGYKVLDSHIGAIYGDSITLDRANEICKRLEEKGFSSSNIVFGVGSYTYQFNTRDTYGLACKATYGEVEGIGRKIFKDPITDDGTKKSLKGLISVLKDEKGNYYAKDQCTWNEESQGELKKVYVDGKFTNEIDLKTIRERLNKTYN